MTTSPTPYEKMRHYLACYETHELLDEADVMLHGLKEFCTDPSDTNLISTARCLIAEYQRRTKK